MSERFREQPGPESSGGGVIKTHDVIFPYRGYHSDGGITRIRVYDRPERSPLVIATELPENPNTSITNLCEYLAWEVGRAYLPGRFESEHPFDWVEHYPADPTHPVKHRREDAYALATFEDYRPRVVWLGGVRRVRIGQPSWTHLNQEMVVALLGQAPDDAQQ
jgi:hypothetical protein